MSALSVPPKVGSERSGAPRPRQPDELRAPCAYVRGLPGLILRLKRLIIIQLIIIIIILMIILLIINIMNIVTIVIIIIVNIIIRRNMIMITTITLIIMIIHRLPDGVRTNFFLQKCRNIP